jgi:hypothetical protein
MLKTLKDNDAEALERHAGLNGTGARLNGIECPMCQAELVDVNPMMALMSHPPRYQVGCSECNWTGTRY